MEKEIEKYEILTVPHPVLKTRADEIEAVDDDIRTQMDRMLETMYDAPGVGLASNQIGILKRVLVMDVDYKKDGSEKNPICMANPEIIWESEELSRMEEGCLSIPQQYADVERPAQVKVKYLDYDGKEQELEADGLLSHCVQHEIDHLDGKLFVDYLSSLKRNMLIKKVKKLTRA